MTDCQRYGKSSSTRKNCKWQMPITGWCKNYFRKSIFYESSHRVAFKSVSSDKYDKGKQESWKEKTSFAFDAVRQVTTPKSVESNCWQRIENLMLKKVLNPKNTTMMLWNWWKIKTTMTRRTQQPQKKKLTTNYDYRSANEDEKLLKTENKLNLDGQFENNFSRGCGM